MLVALNLRNSIYLDVGLVLAAVIAGTIFAVIGVARYFRPPDVYIRLHATGKVGVFGVVLLLLAAVDLSLPDFGKGLVLIVLLMIFGPVASHAISAGAYRIGIPMKRAIRDDSRIFG